MNTLYEIIKRPIISEKSTWQSEVGNRYAFEVAPQANKQEIRQAIEFLFKVDVTGVRTMVMHGKHKRVGRFEKKQSNWKKAIVAVKDGQKIEFFQK